MIKWLEALAWAAIGGAAASLANYITDPATFDWANWKRVLSIAATGAVIALLAFLRQSPPPPWDGTDRRVTS